MSPKSKQLLYIVLGIIIISSSVVFAGSITPSSYLSPTTHTLNDIYQKLTNSSYTSDIADSFSFPTGEATSTMHTLEDIWNLIPTISSSTIISGNTILGIAGSYNTSNLTPSTVASGTVYGNGTVGTMAGANNLVWSDTFGPMTWASSTAYCSFYGDKRSWRLPNFDELNYATYNQANNTNQFNLNPGGFIVEEVESFLSVGYWSSTEGTESSNIVTKARYAAVYSEDGILGNIQLSNNKTLSKYFRCVKNNY